MLSQIESRKPGPANRLVESLRRGDLESAADALDSAAESVPDMSQQEQKELAEQLQSVANDLKKESERQKGKQQQAHDLLSPIYNWFTEGFDTKDIKDAKSLLLELES